MQIGFFGKTGAGKTSLINALFGLSYLTGNFRATTMAPQYDDVTLVKHCATRPVRVVDTPGLAESVETEPLYRQLYATLLADLDHVVWVVPAHPRTFRADQEALISLGPFFRFGVGVTVALTRADTIGPNDWNELINRPSRGQEGSLEQQVSNVLAKFAPYVTSLEHHDIVPCAAPRAYGLDDLMDRLWTACAATYEKE